MYFFELFPWPAEVIENKLNKLDPHLLFYCSIFSYKTKQNRTKEKQINKTTKQNKTNLLIIDSGDFNFFFCKLNNKRRIW